MNIALQKPVMRFGVDWRRCIDGIDFIAQLKPGITPWYIGNLFYLADKAHFRDWGRPISGDRYMAGEHGPIPANIHSLLELDCGQPDEIMDSFDHCLRIDHDGNKRRVYSRNTPDSGFLSQTDRQYLTDAVMAYHGHSLVQLHQLALADAAFVDAAELPGLNNEMDLSLWLDDICESENQKAQIIEEIRMRSNVAAKMEPLRGLVQGTVETGL